MTPMDMSEFKDLFVSETLDHLQQINQKLVQLEQNPASNEALAQIFRSAHTIKGMAATMGYAEISQVAHALEDLLDQVRQGKQAVTPSVMDVLFAGADSMSALVDDVAADRQSELDVQGLTERLRSVISTGIETEGLEIGKGTSVPARVLHVQVALADDCQVKSLRGYMILERLRDFGEVIKTDPPEEALADEDFYAMGVYLRSEAPSDKVQAAVAGIGEVKSVQVTLSQDEDSTCKAREEDKAESAEPLPPSPPKRLMPSLTQTPMVRVNAQHLDLLLNLVSELVISRGQLLEATRHLETVTQQHDDKESLQPLKEALDRHDLTLGRLHEAVLDVRMVPVSQVFDRFPRMVRDLLRDLGKEAEFEMIGRDVEMDRATLEALADPLVHLLRNAVDHGLEKPEARLRMGKPRQGLIRLSARRERGQAIIEVQDDGRGMNANQILELAIQRGIVAQKQAHELSRDQILMLICEPGFSMAKRATDVSGRGVGMDVVKHQVEALRGSMEIETTPEQGTLYRLQLPLSLALTQALLVKVDEETYAVPLHHIEHTIEVTPEEVQRIHRWEIVHQEDGLLPIFSLGHLLGLPKQNGQSGDRHALVVWRGSQRFGLVVDDLLDKQEIVVKPLPGKLAGIPGLSGTTILGAGQVVLILDIPNLVQELM